MPLFKKNGRNYFYGILPCQVGGRVSVNYTQATDETTLHVSFLKAQVSDEGTYVCSVANLLGAVKQAFDLHVESKWF